MAEGYLEVRDRAGMFVAETPPEASLDARTEVSQEPAHASRGHRHQPSPNKSLALYQAPAARARFDFRVGRPAPSSFPVRIWTQLINQKMAGSARNLTEYGDPAGLEAVRIAIAGHLGMARGIIADPDQVIIVGGCEEGLNLVSRLLAPPGSPVYMEDPCYKGAALVFESHGAELIPIPVDDHGLNVCLLSDCPAGLAYVTPSHQFPTGATLPLDRRVQLLDWAKRTGGYIVEDDYDSDFRYDGSPLTALAGLDRSGAVIYVGTFSKSIGAGLRIGYLVVPEQLIGPVRDAKALLNNGNAWLEQAVLAEFISSGQFRTHLRRIRQTYRCRRDCLVDELVRQFGHASIGGGDGGMHLCWRLPDSWQTAHQLQRAALGQGVAMYSLDEGPAVALEPRPQLSRMVLLGYPCLEEAEIVSAVARVAKMLRQ